MSATEQRHIPSLMAIIRMWDKNQADDSSFEYALKRLEQLAKGGNVAAIRNLGTIHMEGKSIPKDEIN